MKSKRKYKHKYKYTYKIKGGAMLASMASKLAPGLEKKEENDSFLVKAITYSTKVLSTVVTMMFSLPTRNLNELIPPKECKKYVTNDYICSQPLLRSLVFGNKADDKKILLDNDDCLQYDETGNQIVSCKMTGGYNPLVKNADNSIENNDKTHKDKKEKKAKQQKLSGLLKNKLDDLEVKLIQINLYLRKYKYPKEKINSLIKKINDKELLQNMLDLCNELLGKNDIYNESYGYRERGMKCDKDLMDTSNKLELNLKLKIKPDSKHIHFFSKYKNPNSTRKINGGALAQIPGMNGVMDMARKIPGVDKFIGSKEVDENNTITNVDVPCETCDGSPMFYVLGKYSTLLSDAILGNKENPDYILINMIREIISMKDDPIGKKIIEILKNIECRSNLRKVIKDHIDYLNNPKNQHKSQNKLHVAMSQMMGLGTDKLSQIPEFENLLHSKQVTSK